MLDFPLPEGGSREKEEYLMSRARARIAFALALALAVALSGAAYAGGADCQGHAKAAGEAGHHHCMLNKNIKKSAEMTADGAVVTFHGKDQAAVDQIKEHLSAHSKGEPCPGCPLTAQEVKTEVAMTDDGGVLTVHAGTPEAVQTVQKWAKAPAGSCCGGKDKDKDKKA